MTEIKLMETLKHPNVVLLMGYCIDPTGKVILVTEFCDQGNLKDVLPTIKDLWTRLKVQRASPLLFQFLTCFYRLAWILLRV